MDGRTQQSSPEAAVAQAVTAISLRKGLPVELLDDLMKPSETFAMAAVGQGYCANLNPQPSDLAVLMQAAKKLASRVLFSLSRAIVAIILRPPHA